MLHIHANHKPQVDLTDYALQRRLLMIPFDYQIPENERISNYEDALLKEHNGIFNWLLTGYQNYIRERLSNVPTRVSQALDEYKEECNYLLDFLELNYEKSESERVLFGDMLKCYNEWAISSGNKKESNRSFSKMLKSGGCVVEVGNCNVRYVLGFKNVMNIYEAQAEIP